MSTILLTYCRDNAALAERLAHELGRTGIPFQHLTNQSGDRPGDLARQVLVTQEPVLLILTDNFLRSEVCMASALSMYQTLVRQNRVLAVVADGRISHDGGQTFEPVPTQFDRVVHAIQYMNFWQTAYLDRSAGLAQVPPAEKEAYEQDLDVVRSIANEIGELFGALREAGYSSWEELLAGDYNLFFQHFNLQEWHDQYRKLAALEVPTLPPIPESKVSKPLAETPTVGGLLVPAPAEQEKTAASVQGETHAFNGMDQLIEEMEEEEEVDEGTKVAIQAPEPDSSKSALERLIDMPEPEPVKDTEHEVQQMIQDAWFWLEKGYTDRGMELFKLALEQHPDHQHLRSEYDRAAKQFGDVQAETAEEEPASQPVREEAPTPPDHQQEAASYYQMGENAMVKGDYLLAKYCWDRVTELQPQFPGIYRKLALLTSDHLTDYKETAAHYLEEALTADPNDADLHFRLGTLLRDHLNQPEQALQHFRDTVVLQPEHAAAWLALAQASMAHPAEAETFYRQAIQLDPQLQTPELDDQFSVREPEQPFEPPMTPSVTLTDEGAGVALPVAGDEQQPDALVTEEPAPPQEEEPEVEQRAIPAAGEHTTEPLTVLITGATSGIGRATAELFAREGHRVMLTGRRADRLEALQQQLEDDFHGDVLTLSFDVRDQKSVQQILDTLPEAWQEVDLLINNAGLAKGLSPIHEGSLDHWETMIDTNLKGLLYVTRCVAPGMVRRRRGHIINIGSVAGKEVYPQGNVYCATKFAVDALTRAMRLDLHAYNIRVSQVSPGHVEETEFALNRFDGDAEKAKIYSDFQPLKASDVADAIYYIATRPPHVNIQDILIFGTQQASATTVDRSGRN